MRLSPDNFVARLIRLAAFVAAAVLLSGCDLQDMYRQPKTEPYMSSPVFPDGTSARPLEADTVARGHLRTNEVFYTGKLNGKEVDALPFPVTKAVLLRGQERFDIFCSPCHDRAGNGNGMIVQRGYRPAGNFHTDRLRGVAAGQMMNHHNRQTAERQAAPKQIRHEVGAEKLRGVEPSRHGANRSAQQAGGERASLDASQLPIE